MRKNVCVWEETLENRKIMLAQESSLRNKIFSTLQSSYFFKQEL